MSERNKASQEGPTPDFIPGWFEARRGNPDPATREAVRIPDPGDYFPITFLRDTERVSPASDHRGFTVGPTSQAGHDRFDLAVVPGCWLVRDADLGLHVRTNEEFATTYTRSDRDWTPPVGRLRDNPHLSDEDRERIADTRKALTEADPERPTIGDGVRDAWKGTPPAEGTRRALIRDTIGEHYEATGEYAVQDRPGLVLSLADRIEEALLGASFRHDERAQTIKPTPIHAQLDRAGIPRGRAVGPSVVTLSLSERVEMLIRRYVGAHPETPGEGKVPSGTRELRVVLEDVTEVDKPPEYRFVEIDNQDGASVGFPMVNSSTGSLKEIVIPYGRDDAWVSEVAYQVAGAATRPLLEDHPSYVFPAERVRDAVAGLLKDFGIARACRPCAEEEIEHGRKEAGDRRDAAIKSLQAEADRLLEGREQARGGEDHFKAQRDSALELIRWLVADLVPADKSLGDVEGGR